MTVRSDQRDILLVETLSIDIEIGSERHRIAGMQLLRWVYLHHIEAMRVHDPFAGFEEFQSGALGEIGMESILVVFDVMNRGLDDVAPANAIAHCLQAALVSAVHEFDNFALLGREAPGHGKRSSDVSFVEFIVGTEIYEHGFSGLYRAVQEVIVVELLENGPARHGAGPEFRPRGPVRTRAEGCLNGRSLNSRLVRPGAIAAIAARNPTSVNSATFFMRTISAGLLTARILRRMGEASAMITSGHFALIAAAHRR
jgi:hypothetical protein